MVTIKLTFSLIIFYIGLSPAQNSWKQIEKDAYRIEYPYDWQLDISGRNKTEFIILSQRKKNDPFRENVNLIIQDLSKHIMNLESFVTLSEELIKKVANSKIISNKKIKKETITCHQIIWRGSINKQLLKFKQVYYIKNNKAYTLTFTSEEKEYDNYLEVGNKILNSFTLK